MTNRTCTSHEKTNIGRDSKPGGSGSRARASSRAIGRALMVSITIGAANVPQLTLAAGGEQLVVPLVQTSGVENTAAPVVTELILEALLTRHAVHALGPSDLKDLLDVEQQKQLVGCDDSSCMRELGGALGASKLVSGMLGRLGDTFVLSVKVIDTASAQVIGRASRKFQRMEDMPQLVGPLIDELLGQAPRAKVEGPKLLAARKEAEQKKRAASVEDFCRAVLAKYQSAVEAQEAAPRLVMARREVLEDLLLTQFVAELESKQECWRGRDAVVEKKLKDRRLAAKSIEEADRFALAEAEWEEAKQNARLLLEAYRTGLEKEKLGTGARPVELPFALRPARAPAREQDATWVAAHDAAAPVLEAALAAVQKADKARFVQSFGAPAKGAQRRADPRDLYVETLGKAESAELDACPWFVLESADIAARARVFAESGRVVSCVRSVNKKDRAVQMSSVELMKENGAWKIAAWSSDKTDK